MSIHAAEWPLSVTGLQKVALTLTWLPLSTERARMREAIGRAEGELLLKVRDKGEMPGTTCEPGVLFHDQRQKCW